MRLVIHSINYYPELTGIGKYTSEMAEWFAERAHFVNVITAYPYYPKWRVSPEYTPWKYKKEVLRGVTVWRCPFWVPSKPSGLSRLIHLMSFALGSLPLMLSMPFWRPDVILVIEPPLFCAPQALLSARLSRAKAWLHIQDFEVDASFDLGLLPSRLRSPVEVFERWLLRQFDRVSTISPRMLDRLGRKGTQPERSVHFPNWVDTETIFPLSQPSPLRQALGLSPETVMALYSGNIGEKQGIEIIIEAAGLLREDPGIRVVICGDGSARERLIRLAKDLPNIHFLPLQPAEQLNDLLNAADIHLLPQRADVADLVMPSKLTGMLASGRPILATAQPGTQVAEVVSQCGLVVPPDDAEAIALGIKQLAGDPAGRVRLGNEAREYAERNLSREAILQRFEQDLLGCRHFNAELT